MYQGAVFFDVDGTLLNGPEGICRPTERTNQAVALLREKGYLTALATGRAQCYLPDGLPQFDCLITCNGALAQVGNEEIFSRAIEKRDLDELTAYLAGLGITYIIEGKECCFSSNMESHYFQRLLEVFHLNPAMFRPLEEYPGFPVHKMMIAYDEPSQLDAFRRDFGQRYDIHGQPYNQSCDVALRGVNKGVCVEKILEYFDIPRERAYAFGDAGNDYEMLKAVGNGIAMGSHAPQLEEVAAFLTDTVQGEGVWKGLCHFGLIHEEDDKG